MNGRLFKELSKTLPIVFSRPQTHHSFYTQIVRPAVRLANTMQESTTTYAWSLPRRINLEGTPIGKDVLEQHKLLDMKTGKRLKPDSLVTADQQGVIGIAVLWVEPWLCRVNEERPWNTLRQGTSIVNLKFPLEKRYRLSTWKT